MFITIVVALSLMAVFVGSWCADFYLLAVGCTAEPELLTVVLYVWYPGLLTFRSHGCGSP